MLDCRHSTAITIDAGSCLHPSSAVGANFELLSKTNLDLLRDLKSICHVYQPRSGTGQLPGSPTPRQLILICNCDATARVWGLFAGRREADGAERGTAVIVKARTRCLRKNSTPGRTNKRTCDGL